MKSVARKFLLLLICFSVVPVHGQSSAPDPKKIEADKLYNDGNGLFRSGNYTGAMEKYQAALALAKDFRYYYQLGLSFKNTRQADKALEAFEESIKLKNDFYQGYNAVGGTLLASRVYDRAIEAFKQALMYNPQMSQAVLGIGEAYAGQAQQLVNDGKVNEAGAVVDEALQQHPNNPKLYLIGAVVYNKLDQPEKAIGAAEEAIKQKKRGARGAEYFEIGIAYKKLKDNDKARAAFAEAKKDPAYSRNAQYELDGLKGK